MIYEFLADGFEETEAITPYDMLKRAGLDVRFVSIKNTKTVIGSHGIALQADMLLSDIRKLPEMVILPGGMPGAKNLRACGPVCRCVTDTAEAGGFVGAICAAPFILGELGLLRGKRATCYPGFEDKLAGAVVTGEKVVRDGKIITAMGMGAALPFGAALAAACKGKEEADRILKSVMA